MKTMLLLEKIWFFFITNEIIRGYSQSWTYGSGSSSKFSVSSDGKTISKTSSGTWNTAWLTSSCSSGYLNFTVQLTSYSNYAGNYFDMEVGVIPQSSTQCFTGSSTFSENLGVSSCTSYGYIGENGYKAYSGSTFSYGLRYNTTGTSIGVLLNFNSQSLTFYRNGITQGVAYLSLSSTSYRGAISIVATGITFKLISYSCTGISSTSSSVSGSNSLDSDSNNYSWVGWIVFVIILCCIGYCIKKYCKCCCSSSNSRYTSNYTYSNSKPTTTNNVSPTTTSIARVQQRRSSIDESSNLGIYIANYTNKYKILQQLRLAQCTGSTALRDAICMGLLRQILIKSILIQSENKDLFENYKFINIVLTDGADTSSKIDSNRIKTVFYQVQQELPGVCETFLIGINLGYNERREFDEYVKFGHGCVHFDNVNDMNISDIFERIQVQIGIATRAAMFATQDVAIIAAKRELEINVRQQKYIILFILDMSGSMSGARWSSVTNAMSNFFDKMIETDIFCCMLFNDTAKFL